MGHHMKVRYFAATPSGFSQFRSVLNAALESQPSPRRGVMSEAAYPQVDGGKFYISLKTWVCDLVADELAAQLQSNEFEELTAEEYREPFLSLEP
jgi:hypothetical protein